MSVVLDSPVFGLARGATYTGAAEAWLIVEGYAHVTSGGVDHRNTTGAPPADDPTLAQNREDPGETFGFKGFMEKPEAGFTVTPNTGLAVGGTAVTIAGRGLLGTTGVTFGGVAATGLAVKSDKKVTCVTPAHAAGAVNVVVTDDDGSTTVTGGFTYS